MSQSIQALKKVTLSVQAGTEAAGFGLTPSPAKMTFIYAVASDGLSPFEVALGEKSSGDQLSFSLSGSEVVEFFGNLFPVLRQTIGLHLLPENLFLHIEILSVADPENREVVQALAGSLAHGGCGGGGGSCDCGCS